MKVITENPVYVNKLKTSPREFYLNVEGKSTDANSSNDEIAEFQKYARVRGNTNVSGSQKGQPLSADGAWGDNTQAAYGIWGKAWELSDEKKYFDVSHKPVPVATPTVTPTTPTTAPATPTPTKDAAKPADKPVDAPKADDKKTDKVHKLMDTIKALSTPKKVMLISGVVILLGGIVWVTTTKKQ